MASFDLSPLAFMRHQYMRGLVARICLRTAFIALLVEAVFLAERFSAIFNQAVDKHAAPSAIALLLFCASPEIFDLAFAISILVAVYQILLRAREDRELMVMAGAGLSIYQLVGVLLGLALFAQLVSLFVSGSLGPAAQYAQRVILFDAEFRALRQGAATSQFYFFQDHVVFAESKAKGSAARHLLIRETDEGKDRVITVDDATLDGPDSRGTLVLRMRDFLAYEFDNGPAQQTQAPAGSGPSPSFERNAPVMTMRANDISRNLQLGELVAFDPRGSSVAEWTLFELLGVLPPPAPLGYAQTRSLGERAARSLLCLLAPLLAGLAIAFTTRATQSFALPLACFALLALNLTATALVGAVIPMGATLLLGVLAGGTAAILAATAIGVMRLQHALVRPALARP